MKFLLLFAVLLFGCGKHKEKEMTSSERLLAKKEFYINNSDRSIFSERCDELTFAGLYSTFGLKQPLREYEAEDGKLIRTRKGEEPCYVEGETGHGSESSISFDPYLTNLYNAVKVGDSAFIERVIQYGNAHNWTMGEGEWGRVHMPHLKYFAERGLNYLRGGVKLAESEDALPNYFGGFRAHVGAIAVDYLGLCDGSIGEIKVGYLKKLHDDNPKSYLINKIYHKWTDGVFDEVIGGLDDETVFPSSSLPSKELDWGWGSAPSIVLYVTTLGI